MTARSLLKRWLRGESGLGVIEIVVAMAIIGIGLIAMLQALPMGVQGMEGGRQQSTALFLAEQRMEQIKAWALSTQVAPPVNQGFGTVAAGGTCFTWAGPNPPAGPCQNQAYNSIANYPGYRVTVQTTADGATRTLVTVQVFYRPIISNGVSTTERSVILRTLLTQR